MRSAADLTGRRFAFWRVIARAPNRGRTVYWRCQCECGNTREVMGGTLRRGQSKSCGCKRFEIIGDARRIRSAASASRSRVDFETAYAQSWRRTVARCEQIGRTIKWEGA